MMMNAKSELKDIQFYEENGQYYLRLKYILEDDYRIEELEIPKVRIPFYKDGYPIVNYSYHPDWNRKEECYLLTGPEPGLDVMSGETSEANHAFYTRKILKEKPKEMTLAEIEKKLGYKVKIVSEDGKDG